jgi:hypothetical protein
MINKSRPSRPPRWHIHIEPGVEETAAIDGDFDEIQDMQSFVELGPNWSRAGYEITITYNLRKEES